MAKGFSSDKRGTFKYTFAHWCAFQMTALNYGVWKFRHLFHDIDKPFRMLWHRGDYRKVQRGHRHSRRHHIEYLLDTYMESPEHSAYFDKHIEDLADWEGMVLDWECSRLTKADKPEDAWETAVRMINEIQELGILYNGSVNAIKGQIIKTLIKTFGERIDDGKQEE